MRQAVGLRQSVSAITQRFALGDMNDAFGVKPHRGSYSPTAPGASTLPPSDE